MKHREKILEKQIKKINDIIHAKMDSLSDEELDRLLDQKNKMGGRELRNISWVMSDLERFIKREANLFIDDSAEKEDDEEEINDTDTDTKIDLWMEEFETNFPGLEIRDSHQFDPNI